MIQCCSCLTVQLQRSCLSVKTNYRSINHSGAVQLHVRKRNEGNVMTHRVFTRPINQPQSPLWSFHVSFYLFIFLLEFLIDTCPQRKDDWTNLSILFPLSLISITAEQELRRGREKGGQGVETWISGETAELFFTAQQDREDEGVWRNAAVQTGLWFSGHPVWLTLAQIPWPSLSQTFIPVALQWFFMLLLWPLCFCKSKV